MSAARKLTQNIALIPVTEGVHRTTPAAQHGQRLSRGVVIDAYRGATLTKQVRLCQVDDFVGASVHHSASDIQAEAGHLTEFNCRWHRELLPMDHDVHEVWTFMGERLRKG